MRPFPQHAATGTLFGLCLVVFLTMLGEEVACAAVSPNLYIMSYIKVQCYLPLRQLHSDFGDFTNRVCDDNDNNVFFSVPFLHRSTRLITWNKNAETRSKYTYIKK